MIFDEAGMAAHPRDARGCSRPRERAGAKVIAIGDPGQLASVQAGGWLRAVGQRLGAVRLTEVMRQRDPGERRALAALHDGASHTATSSGPTRAGRIDTFDDAADARKQAAVAEWAAEHRRRSRTSTQSVMIARDNEHAPSLNHAARELRRDHGLLGDGARLRRHRESRSVTA